jgi:hypothetical protein
LVRVIDEATSQPTTINPLFDIPELEAKYEEPVFINRIDKEIVMLKYSFNELVDFLCSRSNRVIQRKPLNDNAIVSLASPPIFPIIEVSRRKVSG